MVICLIVALLGPLAALALNNGVGMRPAMGFSTWNHFGGNVNASLLMEIADAMATNGMLDAGYEYINLDDGWAVGRTPDGVIIEDPKLFPDGLAAVVKYIHSRGLKFGLYTSRTSETCMGRPGSDGYEKIDAMTYANKFEIDYLKEDSCGGTEHGSQWDQYARMRDALNSTGRPIYFSICQLMPFSDGRPLQYCVGNMNAYTTMTWVASGLDPRTLANSYLVEYCNNLDVFGISGGAPGGWPAAAGFLSNLDSQQQLTYDNLTEQGAYNDNDMLECCNGGQTQAEYRSQFATWAILTSPLILGNDIRTLSDDCKEIVLNKEVIAVNQDANVIRGKLVYQGTGAVDDSPIARMDKCGGAHQAWDAGRADATLVMLGSPSGQCLDIYNCDTSMTNNIFVYGCHPGEPGCGSNNQEWTLAANGTVTTIVTHLDGKCLTVDEDGTGLLSTTPCGRPGQTFIYNTTDKTIRDAARPATCLTGLASWPANNITIQVYAKPLADGSVAVAVFNRALVSIDYVIAWTLLGLDPGTLARVRDLWAHADVGVMRGQVAVTVPPHDTATLRVSPL
eukprot:m.161442 g.161442  ORF g.161442 m.161442 type:complete len:564 (-) comp9865_c0_seq8:47-1738(-)